MLNKKYFSYFIFIAFLIILLFQHFLVFLYHDDYGYVSLSYVAFIDGVNGTDYGLLEIFKFLEEHYRIWGGRVIPFFLEIFLIQIDFSLYRVFQSVCILLIFILILLLSAKKIKFSNWLLSIATVSTFGLISDKVAISAIYWFSASSAYVIPIVFLFGYIYLIDKQHENNIRIIISCILIFLASASQEQIAVSSLSYVGITTIYFFVKERKISNANLLMLGTSILGFLFLVLAPGNFSRMADSNNIDFYESLNYLERIKNNLPYIVRGNFNEHNLLFTTVYFFVTLVCAQKNSGNGNKLISALNSLSMFSSLIIVIGNIVFSNGYFDFINQHIIGYNYILIFQLVLSFFSVIFYFIDRNEISIAILFASGILSQLSLIAVPSDFPYRVHLIFELICFIVFISVLSHKLEVNNSKPISLIVISFSLYAFINVAQIMNGYYLNYKVNKQNDKILTEYALDIKNGKLVDEIYLDKLPNDNYADFQPYREGCEYIYFFMREYYNLPEDVKIIYKDK